MSSSNAATSTVPSTGTRAPVSRSLRWAILAVAALLLSAAVTSCTGVSSYEEQLNAIAAKREFPSHVLEAGRDSPALRQLLLDATGDRAMMLKIELALLKYQDRAIGVFALFGDEARFRQALLSFGEDVIPIIDHFMTTDVASLWAKLKLQGTWRSIFDRLGRRKASGADEAPPEYDARLRGIYAIEAILVDGHHFLGQFVVDKQGRVQRVQTDRVLETVKNLFAGGITDLEQKYRMGDGIAASDLVWAGADVLSVFGVTKAAAFLGKSSTLGKSVEEAASVRRRAVVGRAVLIGESVGRRVAVAGAKAGAIYLLVRHPSLLSGVFTALGKAVGLPAWLSVLAGWWSVCLVVLPLALTLLRGVTLLIWPIRWIAGLAAWISPFGRRQKTYVIQRAGATY